MTPLLTIFTASVREDLARLWLACVRRAFPRDETLVEIFDDSEAGRLRPERLEGATILRPGPGRRDFQEAYNDALGRAATPWLALLDTDTYAVSRDVWPRVRARFGPDVAAVLCAPRGATGGDDTVALVLNVAAYRAACEDAPDGFLPRVEGEVNGERPGQWRGHDTGDLLTRAVARRGGRIDVLPLGDEGAFVRFDALTNAQLLAAWSGDGPLLALAREHVYFREGCLGNIALRRLYARTFPDGPPFSFRVPTAAVWAAMASGGLGSLRDAASRARRMRAGARRIEKFLRA
ncbi:MAG TPA: hypothetical protein VKS23_09060 [Thermoanaerobaculia bacterium]|nr:hypothetical protein [Thermoanaerobaculia bacterium]